MKSEPVDGGIERRIVRPMPYSVQIAESRIIGDAKGESGLASYMLDRRFATITLADEAGVAETSSLRARGVSAFYHALDDDDRPVGPNGAKRTRRMTAKAPKRPRNTDQLAKMVVDLSTGQLDALPDSAPDNPMTELGRSGGLKGGRARAGKLTSERRVEIARQAAAKRWRRNDN